MLRSDPRRPPQPQFSCVDPKIWRACAGAAVKIPNLHSRVYYFPQGHLEQTSSSHYPSPCSLPYVHCQLSNIQFLADPTTDEVFAKLLLRPIPYGFATAAPAVISPNESARDGGDDDKVAVYAKTLTASDANNGGGFSVPRFCADSIFPPLNFQDDPPLQALTVTDVHGVAWEFRHIYRGTPRRHLLTTGWSKFVNHKKLVAGDSVVFMKNSKGEVFVGIRRAIKLAGKANNRAEEEEELQQEGEGYGGGFWRRGKGKVSVKAVAEAAEAAEQNMAFEVVYYPRAGRSDFVVKAEAVEEAMRIAWGNGMRVKMAVETEDSTRMTWFQGSVSSASLPANGPWFGSPWRMLQVAWDEPEVLQNAKRVSPWQVELVSPVPPFHTAFPPTKKLRAAQGSGVLSDREGDPFFPTTGFTNSTMGHLNRTLLSYESFPAGMQGARHDPFSPSSFSNLINDNSYLHVGSSPFGNNTMPMLETVSTELTIGSSQSDNLSPNSQSSLRSFGTESAGGHNCNTSKVGSGSIRLFGKIIKPVESDLHDAGCMGDDGSKGCGEPKGIDKPPKGIDKPPDHSLTYSKLLNRLDVKCK